jgi:hypothetical protein
MTTQTPALSPEQVATVTDQAAAIASAGSPAAVSSNEFVFFAAFDGTDNGANPLTDGSGDQTTACVDPCNA